MADTTQKLKKLQMFEGIPDDEIKKLSEQTNWEVYSTGQEIFEMGDQAHWIFIVAYGAVKLVRRAENGNEVALHFVGPEGIFGAVVAMRANSVYPLTAVAIEDTAILKIHRDVFLGVFQKHPVLGPRLLEMVGRRIGDLHAEKATLKSKMPKRIARFLLRKLESQPETYGDKIMIRLTRQDIANHIGTSVETVIRVLSAWTQDKIITTSDHRIEILDRKALSEIINTEG